MDHILYEFAINVAFVKYIIWNHYKMFMPQPHLFTHCPHKFIMYQNVNKAHWTMYEK